MKILILITIFIIGLGLVSLLSTSHQLIIDAAVFDAPLLPGADNQYDLGYIGVPDQRWQNGYFSGNLTTAGNLSIGTTTIADRLYVTDGSIIQELKTDVGISNIGTVNDIGGIPYDVYVSGKYAYITNGQSTAGLKIIDVFNPYSPAIVGSLDFNQGPRGIYVSGRYAYVTLYGSSLGGLHIIDISNPSSPTSTAFMKTSFNGGHLLNGPYDVYVSGQYAYIISQGYGQDGFSIVDIANPVNPKIVATTTVSQGIPSCPNSIYVARSYAYITGACSGGSNPEFSIVDISNPYSPTIVNSSSFPYNLRGIYASGRYIYTTKTSPSEILIMDVSNPASPQIVATTTIGASPNDIYVAGQYAYTANSDTDNISIVDVSQPNNPKTIVNYSVGNYPQKIYTAGHYIYVTNWTSKSVSIIDTSGLEAVSANIHSLEAGNLQVRNDIIAQGQMQITGGINVGTGGIFSAGPIGISISSTTQTDALSAYFQGRVGIATTTPSQKLEVNGGIRLFTGDSRPTCDANLTRGTLWFTTGAIGMGEADKLEICNSSSTDGYVWKKLY